MVFGVVRSRGCSTVAAGQSLGVFLIWDSGNVAGTESDVTTRQRPH